MAASWVDDEGGASDAKCKLSACVTRCSVNVGCSETYLGGRSPPWVRSGPSRYLFQTRLWARFATLFIQLFRRQGWEPAWSRSRFSPWVMREWEERPTGQGWRLPRQAHAASCLLAAIDAAVSGAACDGRRRECLAGLDRPARQMAPQRDNEEALRVGQRVDLAAVRRPFAAQMQGPRAIIPVAESGSGRCSSVRPCPYVTAAGGSDRACRAASRRGSRRRVLICIEN